MQTGNVVSEAKRLRRKASGVMASVGAMAMAPALSLTKGHHVFAWILIAMQFCMLSIAIVLLRRARRLEASPTCF